MEQSSITIEQVEELANSLEQSVEAARAKLERLIRAYARIVYARESEQFKPRATEYADEDGHWDSSYPPKQVYKAHTGPRLIRARMGAWDEVATSSGFYYEWRAVTSDPGLYVDRLGVIYGASYSGTGRVGQFAAHPGDCDVAIEIEYSRRDADELTVDDLRAVESHMRTLAFPASVAVAS